MLSFFRITNVMSLFVIRYFSDAPFNNCVSGRIGAQVRTVRRSLPAPSPCPAFPLSHSLHSRRISHVPCRPSPVRVPNRAIP
jgi:hypothetical protein